MTDSPQTNDPVPGKGYTPPHFAEELLRRYAAGERYFAHADLREGSDLRNTDLQDAVFAHAFLNSVYFQGANLERVDFTGANVKCSDFRDCKIAGTTFLGAHVEAADFTGADTANTSFAGAGFYGITLKEGDIP